VERDDELQDGHDAQVAFPPSSDDPYDIPRRRRVGGWVVAFVLLLAVSVVSWVLAKPYLVARNAPSAPRLDTRAQTFLADGERAMAEGDLPAAQQDFDKASVLAERDPRVLLDEARVAAATADIWWLKLRLLPADATEELRATKAQLEESMARARKASDDAISLAPDDYATVRAKIDVLRLQGAREAARGYISKLGPLGTQPETAYVLAALDLAEPEPFWTTVIDRLRLAASADNGAGRARAALVYAMAKAGDVAGAKSELSKLDALSRPYPLLPNLHAFVDKTAPKVTTDRDAAINAPRVDVSALPTATPAPPSGGAGTVSADRERDNASGDQSGGMHAAAAAIKKGDWAHARQIYEALVARNPSDSEALSGIGDVDRARGDSAGAIAAYKRALAINPSYLPALLGVADTQWASGDHTNARRSYKDIVDRFPEGTYPAYVRGRGEPEATPSAPAAGGGAKADPGDGI
jgi:tetratricopeptide (TPR) repeat protein